MPITAKERLKLAGTPLLEVCLVAALSAADAAGTPEVDDALPAASGSQAGGVGSPGVDGGAGGADLGDGGGLEMEVDAELQALLDMETKLLGHGAGAGAGAAWR